MISFGSSFMYTTFQGIIDDKWAVYRRIKFQQCTELYDFHEAHVNLRTGEIEFYDDDDPNPKMLWRT